MDLTNQDKVVFQLSQDLVGTVSVGTEKVANITRENGMLKVSFTDNSVTYLPWPKLD